MHIPFGALLSVDNIAVVACRDEVITGAGKGAVTSGTALDMVFPGGTVFRLDHPIRY
jgi:hypothetical protein